MGLQDITVLDFPYSCAHIKVHDINTIIIVVSKAETTSYDIQILTIKILSTKFSIYMCHMCMFVTNVITCDVGNPT